MKNKHTLTHWLFATALLCLLTNANAFGQCEFTVTDSQPYIEHFDDSLAFYNCWTTEDLMGGTWTLLIATNTNVASFTHKNDGDYGRLVSPVLDLSQVSEATMRFSYAMMGLYNNDELTVSYRSSENDEWHDLNTYSLSDYVNYYEDEFTLPDLSSTYQISFLGVGHGGMYILIDNIEIASNTNCSRPINVNAFDITNSTAMIGCSTSGNEEGWIIEVNGVEHSVDAIPHMIDKLSPLTQYTVRVKALCGEGDESEWSASINFTTLCDAMVITDDTPFYDDFEASDEFVCWSNEIISGGDAWVVDPGYVIPNHTAFFIWLGGEARLSTTLMDITNVTNPTLSFKRRQRINSNNVFDDLSVWYRISENDEWKLLANFPFATQNWEEVTLSLPNPTDTYQVSFLATANNAEGVYVDDVLIGDASCVGVAENVLVNASVSPNPTNGKVVVNANVTEGRVVVYDLFGKEVADGLLMDGSVEIDLSACAQGVYMARVTSATGTTTIKLVKSL